MADEQSVSVHFSLFFTPGHALLAILKQSNVRSARTDLSSCFFHHHLADVVEGALEIGLDVDTTSCDTERRYSRGS